MKRSRVLAVVMVLAVLATMVALAVPGDFRGLDAKKDGMKIRYGGHVYSFWKIGEDVVPWDETAGQIPPFLTLKKLVVVHELQGADVKLPAVDLSIVEPIEKKLDELAQDCGETVAMIDWVDDTNKGGFHEALAAGGISDRKDLEDLVAKATWYQGDQRMDISRFRDAMAELSAAAQGLSNASRKFRREYGAEQSLQSRCTPGVLDYKSYLGMTRLRDAVNELTEAFRRFDKAVQAFFPASVTDKDILDLPLPTAIPELNRAMRTLFVLHQHNATGRVTTLLDRVEHMVGQARQLLAELQVREDEANQRAERSRSLVAGWIDQKLAETRRFLSVTRQLEKNFERLGMEPGPVFYQVERKKLQGIVDEVAKVLTTNPSRALKLAATADSRMTRIRHDMVLPGEHVRALQGKLADKLPGMDDETRRRAHENMDKALQAFHRRDAVGALSALVFTTDAIIAGEKVPMVSANTGEPVMERDDLQITVVPPPPGDSFQNPWFLGLVSAALLVPLLVLLYVVRRREARAVAEEESTMKVPGEATQTV